MQQFTLNKRYSFVCNKKNTYQYLLFDNNNNEYFTLNDTIFGFLKLFSIPLSFEQAVNKVVKSEKLSFEETAPILETFINDMLRKGIIIIPNEVKKSNSSIVLTKNNNVIDVLPYITDKYNIVKVLATNTSNIVYLGTPKDIIKSTQKVIIKAFTSTKKEDNLKEFLKEFKVLKKLNHHNIISLIEVGEEYGVVEYFQGKSLLKVAEKSIPMSARILIIEQLVSAFAYLHKNNYLHGDLHPSNILVNKKFQVKLIDFDLATSIRNKTARFGGIREFLAPEIISNDMFDFIGYRPTKQSEVYQLSIMIYFTLYGKFPIERDTWKQHLDALNANQIDFPSENQFGQEIDRQFIILLQSCLALSPQNRPTSAVKMQKNKTN